MQYMENVLSRLDWYRDNHKYNLYSNSPSVSKSLLFFVIHTIIISYFYEAAVYRILLIPPSLFIACFVAICHCEIYRKLVPFKLTNNEEDHDTERWKGKRYRCRALKQSAVRFTEITSYHGGKNKWPAPGWED